MQALRKSFIFIHLFITAKPVGFGHCWGLQRLIAAANKRRVWSPRENIEGCHSQGDCDARPRAPLSLEGHDDGADGGGVVLHILHDAGAYPPFVGVANLSVFGGFVTEGFVERLTGKMKLTP